MIIVLQKLIANKKTMFDLELMNKSIEELTKEEKDFLYKKLLTLFLEWNASTIADEADIRSEIQETVFYFIGLLDKD